MKSVLEWAEAAVLDVVELTLFIVALFCLVTMIPGMAAFYGSAQGIRWVSER